MFPELVKCSIQSFGSLSDPMHSFYYLCSLTVNDKNQKIFLFFWFWLTFLTIATGLNILNRFAQLISPRFRLYLLKKRSGAIEQNISHPVVSVVAQRTPHRRRFNSPARFNRPTTLPVIVVRSFDASQVNLLFRHCQVIAQHSEFITFFQSNFNILYLQVGDWFLLMLLSENVTQEVFQVILDEMVQRMRSSG